MDEKTKGIINELSEFTIANYKRKYKRRSAWGTEESIKEFYKQALGQTIIKRDESGKIEAVGTYQIEEREGKHYCVFLSFISNKTEYNTVKWTRNFMKSMKKEFGFEDVGFLGKHKKVWWI